MHYFIWILISGIFFAIGEVMSKLLANNYSHKLVIGICLASVASSLTWMPAIIQKNQLAVVGTLWSVFALVITVLLGTMLFHENLDREKLTGIVLAGIAVYLLMK